MQHVQSVQLAVFAGPWAIVDGKKNSSSWTRKWKTQRDCSFSSIYCIYIYGNVKHGVYITHIIINKDDLKTTYPYSCCCCNWIRSMCKVCSKLGTDAQWRHSRVSRSQELPPDRHGLISHHLHGNHRARGHKLHQVAAKLTNSWITV